MWNVPLSRNFFLELRDMDPYRELPKYKKPVLIIHGDADPVVPISYSHRAVDAYKKVRLEVIEKAGHGFKPQERNKAIEWIREFLK
jgi:pimeloyl-ACP methyl ester carboxylesterase